jgi:hypothetical protein
MNRITYAFAIALLTLMINSCASKKEDHEHHDHQTGAGVWREMDDFHMIMAETFHPYMDSANLEPAKTRANELLASAEQWEASPLPKNVDSESVKSSLRELKSQAATLVRSVQSGDDNAIGQHLTTLHDTFHAIQEKWYEANLE